MFNKKHTYLLPVQVISVISKYANHQSSCFICIICYNNENESMNGNQQGVAPSEFMSLWLFAKVHVTTSKKILFIKVLITRMLQSEDKEFKLQDPVEGTRNYFHEHPAELWSFRHYFNNTHSDLNKFKKYNRILNDFINDVKWLKTRDSTPETIKVHLKALENERAPSKAALKAEAALPRQPKIIHSKNVFQVNGDNNTLSNFQIGDIINTPESSTSAQKRKHDAGSQEQEDQNKRPNHQPDQDQSPSTSIFGKWNDFLESRANFHPYSPEYHRIIRSGKTVSPLPFLDAEIYQQHVNQHKHTEYPLPENCKSYISNIMDQVDMKSYRKAIRKLPDEDDTTLLFLESQFNAIYSLHTTYQDISSREVTFNNLFLFPFLKAVAATISAELESTKTDFCDGEVQLESMTTQLKALNMLTDDRNQYKADGLIKMYGYKNLEVALLETSSHFRSTDQAKSKFDHHKGLYGSLSMLKTIADTYQYGSLATFMKTKVLFIHAANTTVYLWSMSLAPEGDIYDLWLEDSLEIKPHYDDRLESIPNIIQFYWRMKNLLKETCEMVMALKNEHDSTLLENRFNSPDSLKSLSVQVNPSILRLIEEEDKTGMTKLGPMYSLRQ